MVRTRNPLNIGAAARAMSNFGFSRLRVVNPYEPAFREARSAVGASALLGQTGVAREPLSPEGQVMVQGELWRAVARGTPVEQGARVRVVDVNGLTLTVEKAGEGGA